MAHKKVFLVKKILCTIVEIIRFAFFFSGENFDFWATLGCHNYVKVHPTVDFDILFCRWGFGYVFGNLKDYSYVQILN